jgi:hypothetical protein
LDGRLRKGPEGVEREDLKDLRATILLTAFKLAKANQMPALKALMSDWGTKQTDSKSKYKYFEEPLFEQADEVLKACGDRVPCYLSMIEKSDSQAKDTQFKGIKCAYMLAIYGDEKTPAQIVERSARSRTRRCATRSERHRLPPAEGIHRDRRRPREDHRGEREDR